MKKFLSIAVFVILFVLLLLAIFPLLFKNRINEALLNKINSSIDAEVSYENYQLSLFRSLPDLKASFNGVSVMGNGAFENDTLAAFDRLSVEIGLPAFIRSGEIAVNSLSVSKAVLNLIVNEEGLANWELVASDENAVTQSPDSTAEGINILLQAVSVSDFSFSYHSIKDNYLFSIRHLDGKMNGWAQGMKTILDLELQTPSMNFSYDSIDYLKDAAVGLTTSLNADLDHYRFDFDSRESKLNGMPLQIEGGFEMPGDSMLFDMKIQLPGIEMNELLKQIPQAYEHYLTGVTATGEVSAGGTLKGIYYQDQYPAIDLGISLRNASLQYPDLPDRLNISSLDARIQKVEGPLELLTVGMRNFKMELGGNPLEMHAFMNSLFTDPAVDMQMKGRIDMASLTKVVPLGTTSMKGLLTVDAAIAGTYSALSENNFSAFQSSGNVALSDFFLANDKLPQGLEIKNAALVLQGQQLKVQGLNGRMGKSDFRLDGTIDELISYAIDDAVLKGTFKLQANQLDLNEFLNAYEPDEASAEGVYLPADTSNTATDSSFVLPANINMAFNANVAHLYFDRMDISNFTGRVLIKNQQVLLEGLKMEMLGGTLRMNGSVLADGTDEPKAALKINVDRFSLKESYEQISMVKRYMPFAAKSDGDFSSGLTVDSYLKNTMEVDLASLNAAGSFSTHQVKLVDPQFFSELKSVIRVDQIKNLTVDDFTAGFSIRNGDLSIEPFSTKLAQQPVALSGSYNFGGTLDFKVDATLEKAILSEQINAIIAYVPGHERVKTLDVGIRIKGDAKKPTVSVDSDKIRQQVVKQLRDSSPEELQDAAKKLLRDLFK
ncbi:AsmA-like C-terminal region-containing protein [Roseimarinus sediminis]|uniref:AsmA-like C-terminal region-containing protein n=1 Tax=Roseimarinus sediminis TaxID=1610899 RepID=UPI003D258487